MSIYHLDVLPGWLYYVKKKVITDLNIKFNQYKSIARVYLLYHPLGIQQCLLHNLLHTFLIGLCGVLLETLGKTMPPITKALFYQ